MLKEVSYFVGNALWRNNNRCYLVQESNDYLYVEIVLKKNWHK